MAKSKKVIRVALAGNPNSGKTSIFNGLVGAHQKVGNWAGVTIDKVEGFIDYQNYRLVVVDLPGTYSLTAYSPEELIARNYIIEEKPDVVVNVLDGTNLERNLYLTTQLMSLETNMVIALNMFDEVQKKQTRIDLKQLEKLLGAHVIATNAINRQGFESLIRHIIRVYNGEIVVAKNKLFFSDFTEAGIEQVAKVIKSHYQVADNYRWLTIKTMEQDPQILALFEKANCLQPIVDEVQKINAVLEKKEQSNLQVKIAEDSHAFIRGALQETVREKQTDKKTITAWIDAVLINRFLGLPIFLLIMWLIFQITFYFGEIPMGWIESFFELVSQIVQKTIPEGIIQSVIVEGIIPGVGGVLVFLPNILLLFLCISFLEATGYMARAAFVVDKILHKFGLHGKSFIPMITGFGCSVPAFMSCRTLKNKADRLTTMMIIPFMSCGAKLPVYILLTGAFFSASSAGNVIFAVYLFGVVMAVVSAKMIKTCLFQGDCEPFVMELPPYRLPTIKSLLVQMWLKCWLYLQKAGTIILLASVIIWAAGKFPESSDLNKLYIQKQTAIEQNYRLPDKEQQLTALENERLAKQLEFSVAGRFGKAIEPIIQPLGFDWRIGIALVSGLAAKEVVISSLGTIYALGEEVDEQSTSLAEKLQQDPNFNQSTAIALMIFVLLYIPCLAATTVFHKEAGSYKWTAIYVAYSLILAWVMTFLVYHLMILIL